MDIKIEAVDFKADKKLLDFIDTKIGKLSKFYDGIVSTDVKLKLLNEDTKNNKIAEIKLIVPKTELFAKRNCASFEEAVDEVNDAIKRQLKKYKEKQIGI